MQKSDLVRAIAKNIEEVSGVKLDYSRESTIPKEVRLSQANKIRGNGTGLIVLRSAEETQNMDVVELKQFDPYFLNKDLEFSCRASGCSEMRKLFKQCENHEKSENVKRSLFLCKKHGENLFRNLSNRCAKEDITLDKESFKQNDLTGYTSLVGVLEKAFIHLQSKWWRGVNDFLLAEIFLNARNFLLITNALLNCNENDTAIILSSYLTILLKVLEDSTKLKNGHKFLVTVTCLILIEYGITYEWIHIPSENPSAKIGAGVVILSALFVLKML